MKKNENITLLEYLNKHGMKHQFFAKEIGTTPATISRIVNHGFLPTLKIAIEIEKYTKGAVSVYSWDLSQQAHCINPKSQNQKEKKSCDT